MAQVVLTLLGRAAEDCGPDRGLHPNGGEFNGKKRVFSLFRQGCMSNVAPEAAELRAAIEKALG